MQHLLNKQVLDIEISGIRKFFNMVADEKDIISLTIGQPDFYTPEHIKNAAVLALNENKTSYTPNAGILELRQAISKFQETNYALSYNPDSEIIVTTGASQAIDITFRTILNPGDEVILPGPIYPGYEPLITLAGGKAVHVDTTKDNFKLTKSKLEEHITDHTKCVVIPYPSNPTGASFTTNELQEIVSVIKDKDIFILADEIYSELVYDHKHVSIASFADIRDQTIVVNGVSKSHAMTGFRIGYTLAPEWLTKHMIKVHQYNVSCATSISQYAALEALTNGKQDAIMMREAYKHRRDYVHERLVKMGLPVDKPAGAFYFLPKFPIEKMNSFELGLQLVRKGKVALVPGSSFSSLGEGYMRLSYAYDMDTLTRGLDRIEEFLQNEELR
ncbi:aminotransferase A [Ornithinibacillus sp. L9]|uniref:Aminotransferase n=1 Tax=Ornithinibacillus caprae TaxID=2678566 RepID=A0A6N8FKQ9_9BACI|nr:aminotransferase A [Ornithinibacillus caprae]MUK90242.1 aminotransferase A [Ornithinibacillus caprae]